MEYKSGMKFSATIDGVNTEGVISVENSSIFFCQNVKNGRSSKYKFGYKYSWLKDGAVNNIKITGQLNNKEMQKHGQYTAICGYEVTKSDRYYVFGCGAVRATAAQIKSFAELLNNKPLMNLIKDIKNAGELEEVFVLKPEEVLSLLTAKLPKSL